MSTGIVINEIDKLTYNYDVLIKYLNKIVSGFEKQSALEFYSNVFNVVDLVEAMIQNLYRESSIEVIKEFSKFYGLLLVRVKLLNMRNSQLKEEVTDIKLVLDDIRKSLRKKL